jgi:hypothetical protein
VYYISSLIIIVFSFTSFVSSHAFCPEQNQIKGEFIVVKSSSSGASLKTFSSSDGDSNLKIETIHSNTSSNLSLSKTSTSTGVRSETLLIKESTMDVVLDNFPDAKIQRNCKVESFQSVPSQDTFYTFQTWYLSSLNAPYETFIPLRQVVVAVSDTGVDINHPDLVNNLWRNEAEINGIAGVDDDGNGFVDDHHGYDFGDGDNNPIPSVRDSAIDFDHGTHVAGLIAAQSLNGQGVSGISLNTTQIMALKGFKSNSASTVADLLKTIYYAVDNGADIINASWGSEKNAEAAELEAVNYATSKGVIIVAAAGNSRVPAAWFTPAGIKNVITVGSLNSQDQISTFSNYGESVDFLAPGGDGSDRLSENLVSTGISSDYVELKGTSMSAPLVSGAIAILMAMNPSITVFQAVKTLQLTSVSLSLQPYQNTNDTQTYYKPDLNAALEYLAAGNQVPNEIPDLESVSSYESRSLASEGGSGGGCSNSLASQDFNSSANAQSGVPLGALLLLILPLLITAGYKKRPLKGPSLS